MLQMRLWLCRIPLLLTSRPVPFPFPFPFPFTFTFTFLVSYYRTSFFSVATLLTDIGSSFNKSHMASWLGTSYLLSVCCFTPIYGRLSDIIGRRGAMFVALITFGAGTILCGIAPSMETLIAARALAGMGGGGLTSVGSIIVTDLGGYLGLFSCL